MRLSRVIMLPFALMGGYIAYEMVVNYQYEWSYYLILPVVIIAACLSLSPQIDAIGYNIWPPKPDLKLLHILKISSPTFDWVKDEDKEAFIINAVTQMRKMDFIGMKVEDIPSDVQLMSIYPGLLLEYLFDLPMTKEYNRVVLYKHPFPSPQFKEWHSAEVHHEDGVLLLSMEQMMINYLQPEKHYHVVFDAWIRAALHLSPDLLQKAKGHSVDSFDLEAAQNFLGLEDIPQEVQALYDYLMKGVTRDQPALDKF